MELPTLFLMFEYLVFVVSVPVFAFLVFTFPVFTFLIFAFLVFTLYNKEKTMEYYYYIVMFFLFVVFIAIWKITQHIRLLKEMFTTELDLYPTYIREKVIEEVRVLEGTTYNNLRKDIRSLQDSHRDMILLNDESEKKILTIYNAVKMMQEAGPKLPQVAAPATTTAASPDTTSKTDNIIEIRLSLFTPWDKPLKNRRRFR